jgi:hypothetical protein
VVLLIDEIQKIMDYVINSAGKLGGLPVNAVWALFSSVILAGWIYDKKEAHRKDAADRKIRDVKVVNESKMADALFKLGDAYERLADTHKAQIDIILNLRRP